MTDLMMDPATEGGKRRGSQPCRWILRWSETGGGDHDPDDGSGDRRKEEAAADRASGAGAGPRARVGGGGELVPRGHVAAAGWMAAAGGRCPVGSGHVRRWRG